MPIDYEIDPNSYELFVQLTGAVSDRALLDAVERILKDPLLPKAPRVLWDAREREDVPFSKLIAPLHDLLLQHESALRGGRCALVAAETASFGMQRMFSLRSDSMPFEVEAFRDLAEARSWLEDSGENGAA